MIKQEFRSNQQLIAVLCSVSVYSKPDSADFITERGHSIQVGVLCKSAGEIVKAHQHLPEQKVVRGCQEVLIVTEGELQVTIYDTDHNFVGTTVIYPHQIFIQYVGGHKFEVLDDVQFIEIKQGPYTPAAKVFFNPLAHEQTK